MTDRCADRSEHQDTWADSDALGEADTQLLQSLGLHFMPQPDTPRGSAYISDFCDVRSLQFNHRTVQSAMRMSSPLSLELDYTRVMMGFLLFNPAPRIIDMIGLGGGSLSKYCYYNVPSSVITAVEISGEVIALRDRFMIPEDNLRLKIVHGDGADYVRQSKRRADVLLIDGFDDDGQPPQLCSQKFYNDCYDHLAPGGILVANLLEKHGLFIDRLRKSFGKKVIVLRTQGGDNRAVFAVKSESEFPAPDYEKLKSVHGGRSAEFLHGIAQRMAQEFARLNLLANVRKALTSH